MCLAAPGLGRSTLARQETIDGQDERSAARDDLAPPAARGPGQVRDGFTRGVARVEIAIGVLIIVAGAVLGIVAFYLLPQYYPAVWSHPSLPSRAPRAGRSSPGRGLALRSRRRVRHGVHCSGPAHPGVPRHAGAAGAHRSATQKLGHVNSARVAVDGAAEAAIVMLVGEHRD